MRVWAINLSILDFKNWQGSGTDDNFDSINLSILDFKKITRYGRRIFFRNYKSIHIGF